ncbi:hypothetical protein A3D03_01985 [Candidatus Gottesmanbacteria bacterium RIFCSPHIGHO2_02_FULL_40_13]|uniref:DUF192 domain-containing protein n=1 Tax=Candidatus Gottesmanbacteria bacterium RIFCSPHIGHO2_02_FULL_40_13 TaxID=1798384 RepID=A0A1F6ABM8_9BACT|nr:MAG: hypothetical protein A3D03_01985 [Candidatus Gottesmanbacteria bacterium RIFCSPHIGHO2_02_FULL_40_13]
MKIIRLKAVKADNFWDKCVGLIGKDENTCLYLETRFGLHTFGMRHIIDILILDKKDIVSKIKISLSPNRFFFWKPVYYKVLELPSGLVSKKSIQFGDRINLKFLH